MTYSKVFNNNLFTEQNCSPQHLIDENRYRYVGWEQSQDSPCVNLFFSPETVSTISKKCTQLLEGVDQKGRQIRVVEPVIYHVMSQIYQHRTPRIGDIYTRYIIPDDRARNDVQQMINQSIEIIVSNIKNEIEMAQNNSELSIWDSALMGDFNRKGLRQHPPIKIRQKYPLRMMFNMNY